MGRVRDLNRTYTDGSKKRKLAKDRQEQDKKQYGAIHKHLCQGLSSSSPRSDNQQSLQQPQNNDNNN